MSSTEVPPLQQPPQSPYPSLFGAATFLNEQSYFFSRRKKSNSYSEELEEENGRVGFCSPWAVLTGTVFLTVPVAYVYIVLILLREFCLAFPDSLHASVSLYLPPLASMIAWLQHRSSRAVEIWCCVEGLYFIFLKLHIAWLQRMDTLEASLSAAPIMSLADRRTLWKNLMAMESTWHIQTAQSDVSSSSNNKDSRKKSSKCSSTGTTEGTQKESMVEFLQGWFFGAPLENISKYDVRDFLVWCMFEGRHQEHLSTAEWHQLEDFLQELQHRVSLELYGIATDDDEEDENNDTDVSEGNIWNTDGDDDDDEEEEDEEFISADNKDSVPLESKNDNENTRKQPDPNVSTLNSSLREEEEDTTDYDPSVWIDLEDENCHGNSMNVNNNVDTVAPSTNQSQPPLSIKSHSSLRTFSEGLASPPRQNVSNSISIRPLSCIVNVSTAEEERNVTLALEEKNATLDMVMTPQKKQVDPLLPPLVLKNASVLAAVPATHPGGWRDQLPQPKKMFHFQEEGIHNEELMTGFFSNLYESYRKSYDLMVKNAADKNPSRYLHEKLHPKVEDFRNYLNESVKAAREKASEMGQNAAAAYELPATPLVVKQMTEKMNMNFHPVQDFRNFMAETAQHFADAEETAMATGRQVYESIVPSGSIMDKQLSAMSHATYQQLADAWNSVKNMKERLETARFLSKQRHRIQQQLKGYRLMLNRMVDQSSAVPSKQMASLMRRITECNEALERLEFRAQSAFQQATGFARKNVVALTAATTAKEPQRFAKYSNDPLLGIATYPLGFNLLVLGLTEIPLRVMMRNRGFERRSVGPVCYYFHPGTNSTLAGDQDGDANKDEEEQKTPIVFVHGIGIGLIVYMPLIDYLLKSGRPILLPEIPYVTAFRPWQSPHAVLQPAVVCSTVSAMLATHGFLRGTFVAHSYGSSWLSYMCKYAPHAVAALLFLDPICFCLHHPRLTKSFVYSRPDPGTVSYLVRTDVMVNWTIQRSFPWQWIILFADQIKVPCTVFLSAKDALVPAAKVESYLRGKNVPVCDFENAKDDFFDSDSITCTVFRDLGHGDWTERPSVTVPTIASATEVLCRRAEQQQQILDEQRHERMKYHHHHHDPTIRRI